MGYLSPQFGFRSNTLCSNSVDLLVRCFGRSRRIIIPRSIVRVKISTFDCRAALRRIALPGSLHLVSSKTFGYYIVRRVIVPSSIAFVKSGTFCNYRGLGEIVLPRNLIAVNGRTFGGYPGLRRLEVPTAMERVKRTPANHSVGGLIYLSPCCGMRGRTLCATSVARLVTYFDRRSRFVIPSNIAAVNRCTFYYVALGRLVLSSAMGRVNTKTFSCDDVGRLALPGSIFPVCGKLL